MTRKITATPLPSWWELIATLKRKNTADTLASPWCRDGESALWFSRSSWSLARLAQWRKAIFQKNKIIVWLPDFFCNTALAHLRADDCEFVFYPLGNDLNPDWDACNLLVTESKPDIFVLVHYFGNVTEGRQAVEICNNCSAWLVEDAAHVLRPIPGIGECGDFVLYSPHKLLAIPDGAVLVLRADGPSKIQVEECLKFKQKINDEGQTFNSIFATRWLVKRLFQKLGVRRRKFPERFGLGKEQSSGSTESSDISPISRNLLAMQINMLDNIAATRRKREVEWRRVLDLLGCSTPEKAADNDFCPYLLPCELQDESKADQLFISMQESGIPVSPWPDLPPEVLEEKEKHQVCISFRQKRIYLPVHQSLQYKQIISAARKLISLRKTAQSLTFEVREADYTEWMAAWRMCTHNNLLQSWEYGAAKEEVEGWRPCRLIIETEDATPIALIQVLLKGIPLVGSVARVNRGPLFIGKKGIAVNNATFDVFSSLMEYAKQRCWRLVQIAPELPPEAINQTMMELLGFRKVPSTPWGSALLDLTPAEDEIMMSLKGKWRNTLRKGLKQDIVVNHDHYSQDKINLLLNSYQELKNKRHFTGLSENLISSLFKQQAKTWKFNLFLGARREDDEMLGMLVTIQTGDTAIYCIGTTTDVGKQLQVNSVLLWNAILHAKNNGCRWFDVGGLNDDTPAGIASFKRGLNATPYTLIGEWRNW